MSSIRARSWVLTVILACGPAATVLAQPAGSEFRVNTYTTNKQDFPSAAADSVGNFVVVWASYQQDGSNAGVYGQRYSSAGAPLGGEFRVNTTTTGPQNYPQVASDSTGNFVVVWQGNDYAQTFAQRFSSTGAPLGGELHVNTSGYAGGPAVASSPTGDFVVVWVTRFAAQILGQRFSSSGAPIGTNFPVTPGAGTVLHPRVASDSGGNFVVVFTDSDGYGNGVFGQRFSSAGAPLGSEFQINTYTTSSQIQPVVASDGSGNFVVVWYDQVQGGGADFGRRFASTGEPLTGEFRIDTSGTAARQFPTVASDAAGNFVAAWTRLDGGTIGVSARLFSSTGAP